MRLKLHFLGIFSALCFITAVSPGKQFSRVIVTDLGYYRQWGHEKDGQKCKSNLGMDGEMTLLDRKCIDRMQKFMFLLLAHWKPCWTFQIIFSRQYNKPLYIFQPPLTPNPLAISVVLSPCLLSFPIFSLYSLLTSGSSLTPPVLLYTWVLFQGLYSFDFCLYCFKLSPCVEFISVYHLWWSLVIFKITYYVYF